MNVIGYIRVSSTGQLDGDGPERQQKAINDFCVAHNLSIVGVRTESMTGRSEGFDRPVFSEIAKTIAVSRKTTEPVEGIVVENMDRLARDLMVSEILLRECRKLKIKVFTTDQGALIDVSGEGADPTRVLIRQVLGAVAQFEKSMLVKKLRGAINRVKSRTGRCDGAKPYGHYPGESQILTMAKDFKKQGHTLNQIASLLNDADFRTRFGKHWTKNNLHHLI